jgi:CO/xanthine dehydrogenase FAD-binding subunit
VSEVLRRTATILGILTSSSGGFMKTIAAYHRPDSLDGALSLLARSSVTTVVVAGGTYLNTEELTPDTEVVDIQSAVAAGVARQGDRVIYGAMTRLTDLIEHDETPPLLVTLARREGPSTLRNAATIGGTIAGAHPESELVAGLLVHDAAVTVAGTDVEIPVSSILRDRSQLDGAIIVSVSVGIGGQTTSDRTGRTPADSSIVAAAARVTPAGLRVALTGVAATPVLVDPDDLSSLDPPADFRGSSEYRLELARILTERVVTRLGGAS